MNLRMKFNVMNELYGLSKGAWFSDFVSDHWTNTSGCSFISFLWRRKEINPFQFHTDRW